MLLAVFTIVTTAVIATLMGVVQIAIDRDVLTAVNTALNFASWWLLINAQRKLRTEVNPKLDQIEEAVTAALESRLEGGQRRHDPTDSTQHHEGDN